MKNIGGSHCGVCSDYSPFQYGAVS